MPPATMIEAFTWEDLQKLPQNNLRYEILDGELIVSPAPDLRHQDLVLRLTDQLLAKVDKPGLGKLILSPFDVKLTNTDVYEPDLLVLTRAHRDRLTPSHLEGPPDLAIEVVSPGSARRDRGRKKDRYALFGIREYWIVDPRADLVDQYVLEDGSYRHVGRCTETIAVQVLPGVEIDLRQIW